MKNLKFTILAIVLAAIPCIASADTSTPPTFLDTVKGYFSSFNPALTNVFSNAKSFDLWTAAEQNLGNNMSADLGGEYTFYRVPTKSLSLSAEGVLKAAGVGGTIVAGQGGFGVSYTHLDAKLTLYGDFGYDNPNARPVGEIGLRFKKALTDNTYAGAGLGFPIEKNKTGRQNIYLFAGVTF